MIGWIVLGIFFYILLKLWKFISPIFQINQTMKQEHRKKEVRTKIKKMDILDAEFEEDSE